MTKRFRVALVAIATGLATVAASRPAAADVEEWVRLKDGTIVQGSLVELTPNDHITIHLATGEIRRIAWADIDASGSGSSDASASPPTPAFSSAAPMDSTVTVVGPAEAPPPKVSHVGAWAVDIRIPLGVTVTSPGPVMNMIGVAVGVGKRLTHDLYLGASFEYSMEWNVSDELGDSSGIFSLYRAGAELHYIVHRGTAQMSTDDVTYSDVPSQLWIGGRVGPESTTLSSVQGLFGEADVGWDARLGTARAQFGMIMSAGLSLEPTGALGSGMSFDGVSEMPAATARVNPYFALSFHFVIGG